MTERRVRVGTPPTPRYATVGDRSRRWASIPSGSTIIRERWATDAPAPLRDPLPILIGGSDERVTLRLAAQHARLWNGGDGSPEEFRRKNQVIDARCREIGRDPAAIERVARVDLPATPEQFDARREAGAQHLILRLGYPWDLGAVERLVVWRDRHGAC